MTRWAWFALGWVMVALGLIGAVLPVMPTTIFLIFAAGCFSRSSPRFEAWLLDHRWMGPPIRRWRERGAIPTGAKILAIGSMGGGYALLLLAGPPAWVAVLAGLFVAGCAIFVGTRPAR